MTNTTFKWNEANTEELIAFVGDESPISTATVEAAAEKIGTSWCFHCKANSGQSSLYGTYWSC